MPRLQRRSVWLGRARRGTARIASIHRLSRRPILSSLPLRRPRLNLPDFKSGDTVKVNVKVIEGNRERIQTFEGVIIAANGAGVNKTITVRKLSFGVGVERIFPVHAPIVDSIEVVRKGKVRRSKLYYLRDRVGKSAKIKEDRN